MMTLAGWERFKPSAGLNPQKQAENTRARSSKYHAEPMVVDGIRFDSKREAARWQELRILEAAGCIRQLQRQVRFALNVTAPNGATVRVADWVADFTYRETDHLVVEDSKGYRNAVYLLKRRHFEAQYGIGIRET